MLKERLEKLESYMKMEDRVTASDIIIRVYNLERKIEAIGDISDAINRMIELGQKQDEMKPFKCPVCDGKRDIFTPETMSFDIRFNEKKIGFSACNACEGKGIVWSS